MEDVGPNNWKLKPTSVNYTVTETDGSGRIISTRAGRVCDHVTQFSHRRSAVFAELSCKAATRVRFKLMMGIRFSGIRVHR